MVAVSETKNREDTTLRRYLHNNKAMKVQRNKERYPSGACMDEIPLSGGYFPRIPRTFWILNCHRRPPDRPLRIAVANIIQIVRPDEHKVLRPAHRPHTHTHTLPTKIYERRSVSCEKLDHDVCRHLALQRNGAIALVRCPHRIAPDRKRFGIYRSLYKSTAQSSRTPRFVF